jgi:hypothetical protein
MRAFGVPEEDVRALEGDENEFEVEPDNWPAVVLWMACQTQWRSAGAGRYGLDYTAVDVVMRRRGMADEDGTAFAGLQVMEIAALGEMARK